jgi:hypothetical protein
MGRRLTTVAAFDEPVRANLARNVLAAAGIEATIADSEIVAMDWLLSNAVGGIKVQVWEEDAERAAAVLEDEFGEEAGHASDALGEAELARQALAELPEEEIEVRPEEVEPVEEPESSDEVRTPTEEQHERDEYARRLLYAAVFSLLFFPLAFYALYLVLNAAFSPGPLSDRGRTRLLIGGVIMLIWVVPFLLIVRIFLWGWE